MLSAYQEGLLSTIGINSILALSVYVILATGQLSLGNAGFMAMGAYITSFLSVEFDMPLTLSLVIAGVVTGVFGFGVGIPALRFRGIYLAMATLAIGEVIRTFFLNFEPTGGTAGYSGMTGVGIWEIWAWVIVLFGLVFLLQRSPAWLKFRAVEDDDFAAEIAGINTTAVKTTAFGFGAVIAAVAGGLFAQYTLYIEPNNFNWVESIDMVLFVIIGGSTVLWGPLAGAVLLTLLPELLRPIADWRLGVYGALLVIVLIIRPQGLLARRRASRTGRFGSLGRIFRDTAARAGVSAGTRPGSDGADS